MERFDIRTGGNWATEIIGYVRQAKDGDEIVVNSLAQEQFAKAKTKGANKDITITRRKSRFRRVLVDGGTSKNTATRLFDSLKGDTG